MTNKKKQKGKSRDSYKQKKDVLAPDPKDPPICAAEAKLRAAVILDNLLPSTTIIDGVTHPNAEAFNTVMTRLLKIETQSEHRGIASRTTEEEIHPKSFLRRLFQEKSTLQRRRQQQQRKPSKRRQRKKSLLPTMSTDQCQVHPVTTNLQEQKQRKPRKRRHKKKSLLSTITDECQTDQPQESTTTKQRLPREQRVANYRKECNQNRIKVAKLSAGGIIEHLYIPTRSQWLKVCREEWGTTEEETEAFIKDASMEQFDIEVCGLHKGYGVIIRDSMRNPVLAISKVAEDYVSPFYHELQGVSLALKLAMKHKIFCFLFYCISEDIAEYVTLSWSCMYRCDCPSRDNPRNPGEKLDYCVKCSAYAIDEAGERNDANKILSLIDEIFSDALEFERQGYLWFHLCPTEFCAKAVQHLANSGIDQEMRIDEIEEDGELSELLYKDVFGHSSLQEVMLQQQQQLKLQKERRKLQIQRNLGAECSWNDWRQ